MNMKSYFNKKELALLVFLMVLGILSLAAYLKIYPQSFPTASLNFKINRQQARQQAEAFLANQGYKLSGYMSSSIFDSDSVAENYLEQTVGLNKSEELLRGRSPVWYWRVRWYRPLQAEEFEVGLSPEGRLIYFNHKVKEDSSGANLTMSQALTIAQKALNLYSNLQVEKLKLVNNSATNLKARTDYYFTWEDQNFALAEGRLRYTITVHGDKPGSYSYFIKVPEKFTEDSKKENSKGSNLAYAATFFAYFLGLVLFISFILAIAQKRLHWKFLLFLGLALGTIKLAGDFNSLPLFLFNFKTTSTLSSFLTFAIALTFIGAVFSALGIIFLGSSGNLFYHEALPQHQSLRQAFSLKGILSKEFVKAALAGYSIAFIHLAYVAVFYWVGQKYFKVWSPAEAPYENFLSTYLPWIYPLTLGAFAAVQEEFFFRLFCISFIKKYLKSTLLAVLIPAVIWAFMHCNYPQQPFYIRGLELTVIGIILGWAFQKYGIWCTLIAHYVVNASMGSALLLKSSSAYFKISGLVVCGLLLLPLAAALFSMLTGKATSSEIEKDEPAAPPQHEPSMPAVPPSFTYTVLEPHKIIILGIITVLSIAIYIAGFKTLGTFNYAAAPELYLSRLDADKQAEGWLRDIGLSTSGFKRVTYLEADSHYLAGKFFLKQLGTAATRDWFKGYLPFYGWRVRYFKPMQKESLKVLIDGKGAVQDFSRELPENIPGASLKKDQALELAEYFLSFKGNLDIHDFSLKQNEAESRPLRKDYTFVWERKTPKLKDAAFRTTLVFQGDKPGSWQKWVKLPEDWQREEEKTSLKDSIISVLMILMILGLTFWLAAIFIKKLAAHDLSWSFAFKISGFITGCKIITFANDFPVWLQSYPSSTQSLKVFYLQAFSMAFMGWVGIFLFIAALVALAEALYRQAFPALASLQSWFAGALKFAHRAMRKEALVLAGCLYGADLSVGIILAYLQERFFRVTLIPDMKSLSGWDSFIPALQVMLQGLAGTLIAISLLLILVALGKIYLKSSRQGILIFLGLFLLMSIPHLKTPIEYLWLAIEALIYILLLWWFLNYNRVNIRHNLLALVLLLFFRQVLPDGWLLWKQPQSWLHLNGIAIGIFSAVLVLCLFVDFSRGSRGTHRLA